MKNNNKTITKRGKIIAILIAALLACCIIVSGVMLFKPQKNTSTVSNAAAGAPSSVMAITVKDNKTKIAAGEQFTLRINITTARADRTNWWFAMQTALLPTKADGSVDEDLMSAMSMVSQKGPYRLAMQSDPDQDPMPFESYSTNVIDNFKISGPQHGLFFMMSKGIGNAMTIDNELKFEVVLKVADTYTGSSKFSFAISTATGVSFVTSCVADNASNTTQDSPQNGRYTIVSPTFEVGEGEPVKSNDATLKSLTLTSGGTAVALSPAFASGTVNYTAQVDDLTAALAATGVANDTKATVGSATITGSDPKVVSITVTAEDGTTKTYSVSVSRKPIAAAFTNVQFSSTSATSGFANVSSGGSVTWKLADHAEGSKVYFKPTVPAGVTVSAGSGLTASSTSGVYEGTLAYGANTFKLRATGVPASDVKEFTYTVQLKEQISTITALSATGTNASEFSDLDLTSASGSGYTKTVENNVSSLTLSVTLGGAHADLSVTGGTKSGSGANRTVTCNLTEGGTTTVTLQGLDDNGGKGATYTIKITRKGAVAPAVSSAEYSATSSGYATFPANRSVTRKLADFSGGEVYFRMTVPEGVTLTPKSGGLTEISHNGTQYVFSAPANYGANAYTVTAQGTKASQDFTYTLTLREQINTISSITADEAIFSELNLGGSNLTYSKTVEYGEADKITLVVTLDGDHETLNASGSPVKNNSGKVYTLEYKLNVGANTITLSGKPDDGTAGAQYTIRITRNAQPGEDATLKNLTLTSGGKNVPLGFSSGTLDYTVEVEDISAALVATATKNDVNATLEGPTETTVDANTKKITVKVTAQDKTTTQTYTVTVKRKLHTDATLGDLKITVNGTDVALSPAFVSGTENYTAQVEDIGAIDESVVTATAKDANATVTKSVATNPDGSKTITVTVTAEDGATKTYTVSVSEIPKNGDTALDDLKLTADGEPVALSPAFAPGTKEYTAEVEDIGAVLEAIATPRDGKAETDTQVRDNPDGSKTVTVTVTAEDGSEDTYVITVREKQPVSTGDAYLGGIYVNKDPANLGEYARGELVYGFGSETFEYRIYVPSVADRVRVTAIAAESNASVVMFVNGEEADRGNYGEAMDYVNLPLVGATARVEFVVTTADDSRTYLVLVTRSTASPYLSYLTVGSYQIFDANGKLINGENENAVRDVSDFYVTIPHAVTIINVDAQAKPDNATVILKNDGKFTVTELFGGNATAELSFSVVVLDGGIAISDTVNYTLHFTREPALSDNVNARIIIDEITKQHNDVIFNDEYAENWESKFVYGTPYHVAYNVSALTIHIYPDEVSDLIAPPRYQIFYGDELKNDNGTEDRSLRLNYGINVVIITISSSDGSASRTIAVIVYREEASLFPSPSIAEIPDFTDEYKPEVTDYSYTVGNDVKKLTVQYLNWDKDLYTCVVDGADELKTGLNVITISLFEKAQCASSTAASTANPNAVRTITLSVFRESNGPSTVWLVLFIVFLILAILEFIILLLLLLRNKREPERVTEKVVYRQAAPAVRPQVAPVQFVQMPQPQVQYVQVPQPQPAEPEKPQQPVNVEVKITGCGDSDGFYKTKK